MKKAGFFFSLLLATAYCSNVVMAQTMFQKIIGGTAGDEIPNYTQMTLDSGQIMVGTTDGFGSGGTDIYLTKTDANGILEWNKTYGGTSDDVGSYVEETSDGGYIIVGWTSSAGAGGEDVFLIKTDALGDTLWTKTYGGGAGDRGYSVQETFGGGYVLVGYTGSFGSGADDVYVIKTDASGDTTWTRTYGTGNYDYGYHIIQTADSGYIFTGEEDYWGGDNAFLIRTDSMGDTLWTKTYGGGGFESGWRVIETMDGGYAFAGWTSSFGAGGYDFLFVKTDAMGDTLWTRTYGGSLDDVGLSLFETADSSYLMSGYTFSFGVANGDAYAIDVDSIGTNLWSMVYGSTSGESAISIEKKADGGYVVGAYSYSLGSGDANFYLLHTDSTASTGSCYELSVSTVTTSSAMTIGTLNVGTAMGATTGNDGTTVTSPAGTSRAEFSTSIGSSTNVGCNADSTGTATALPTGGTAPYTYVWDDPMAQSTITADSLPIGSYMVMVTDASGCLDSASVTITEPTMLTASISDSSSTTCNADSTGSSTVTPAGGTAPYAYLWDDINAQTDSMAIGLPAANYSVTVTDNNSCIVVVTTSVAEPTVLALSTTMIAASCGLSDGSANVNATGATAPYVYSWNTSPVQTGSTAIGLALGSYTVTVIDSLGCTDSAVVSVTNAGGPIVAITDSVDVLCNGDATGSATVSTTGGTLPYTFLWDDGNAQTDSIAVSLPMGTYTVNVTDSGGCGAVATVTITEPPALTLSVASALSVACNTDSSATMTATAGGGTGTLTYIWDDPAAQTTAVATGIANGSYSVVVTDSAGCTITDGLSLGFFATISSSASPVCGLVCDGNATVLALGAQGTVTYSWDDPFNQNTSTATGLCEGNTFTGTITDSAGCSASASVVFPVLSVLDVQLIITDILCFGNNTGAITAFVSGGGGGYQYTWTSLGNNTPFVNSLIAGSYEIIVTDANGCSVVNTGLVTEPSAVLNGTIVMTPTSCFGGADGAANLTVTGGTTPYTYKWVGGSATGQDTSDVKSGNYQCDITDANGCTFAATVFVSEPNSIVLSGSSLDDSGNSSGQAWVSASGGVLPYIFLWDDGLNQTNDTATGLTAGEYSVLVIDDNGCMTTLEVAVGAVEVGVFETTYEGNFDDLARDVDIITGGGHIIAGITESFGVGVSNMYLVKTDENGNYIWGKAYGGSGDDGANAVLETSDGGFIMAGYTASFGAGSYDMYVVKTDVDGGVDWSMTYGGSLDERAYSIVELSGGGYTIAGGSNSNGAGSSDVYVVNVDANGAVQWTQTYGGSGYDYGYDIKSTSDGGYIIAGYTFSFGAGEADAYLIKTDANGVSTWTKVMGGDGDDAAWSVIETTNGYALTGNTESFGSGQVDVYFVLTDATGNPTLTKAIGGSAIDYGNDLIQTADGGFAIVGYSKSFNNDGDDVYLIKTDASGDVLWSKTYGGSFNDRGWAIEETSTGELVIGGNSRSFGLSVVAGFWEYYLIRTDALGNSKCNNGGASSAEVDTIGFPITIGGLGGSGGTGATAATVETNTATLFEFQCYNSNDIKVISNELFELVVYPNPNDGQFNLSMNLKSNSSSQLVRIYNISGGLMSSEEIPGSGKITMAIDLGNVPAGMYYVQVLTDGQVATKKVIVH